MRNLYGCGFMDELVTVRREIIQFMSPKELFPCLCEHDLAEFSDRDVILNESITRKEQNERILALLGTRGPQAYTQFLECLAEETEHLGHTYILHLLRGECLWKEEEVQISCRIQKQAKKNMRSIVKGVNFEVLAPHLHAYSLLTEDEHTAISSCKIQTEGICHLLDVLATKGPTAYYRFARSLDEESEHCTHQELFQMITDATDFKLFSKQQKRKAESEEEFQCKRLCTVTTRHPDRLRTQGTLHSKDYFECMRKIRKFHLTGRWKQADSIVKESILKGDKEFHIAILLEECTGYITRRDRDTVLLKVGRAMQLCDELPSSTDNRHFLVGRCKWVLAKLYRYTQEPERALTCIEEATEHQSNIASGEEDAALTTYCRAMILLEHLNNPKYCKAGMLGDRKHIQDLFERAIDYASNPDYGLDTSHPLIRLAQLHLGSSPFQPGRNHDPSSISKANDSLNAVNFDVLAPRTRCLFCYTKSDLVYSHSKDLARDFAQRSLDIATQNGFETEQLSAQARLDNMN